MIDLQQFINTIPDKITRRKVAMDIVEYKIPYKTEVALRAYAQHDALHYLFNQPFTEEGEKKVAWAEYKFNRGWYAVDEKYNQFFRKEFDCSSVTHKMIDEIALKLYEVYDDYQE